MLYKGQEYDLMNKKDKAYFQQFKQSNGYFYYTYKIILTNGSLKEHFYLGQHYTKRINDSYKGSGRIIRNYYKTYPNDYKIEIFDFYHNSNELNEAEKQLIGTLYEDEPLCLNLCAGGNQKFPSEETRKLMSLHNGARGKPGTFLGKKHTEETKKKISMAKQGSKPWNLGIKHTQSTKEKIRAKATNRKFNEQTKLKMSQSQLNSESKYKEPILQYTLDGKFVKEYKSIGQAIKQTGIWGIKANVIWRTKSAGNYIWIYKNIDRLLYYVNRSERNITWDFTDWNVYENLKKKEGHE